MIRYFFSSSFSCLVLSVRRMMLGWDMRLPPVPEAQTIRNQTVIRTARKMTLDRVNRAK